ncbi:MAG: hypothetical protein ACI9ES_001539 [Oceanospirillaceae bacterium]|jgi:hypothetical protein
MAKRYNPNKCKINRNYTISEIGLLYGVHKKTVASWLRRGLKKIDNQRPYLILGRDLKEFIKDLRTINKQPCDVGEIYCMKCRSPRKPEQGSIIFETELLRYGHVKGSCNVCHSTMNKYFRLADILLIQRHFAVILPLQQKRLG